MWKQVLMSSFHKMGSYEVRKWEETTKWEIPDYLLKTREIIQL